MKTRQKTKLLLTLLVAIALTAAAIINIAFMSNEYALTSAQASINNHQQNTQRPPAREQFAATNFDYNSINVILTTEATRQFLHYTIYDFSEVNATAIAELTSYSASYVQSQFTYKHRSGGFRENTSSLIDINAFKRIFNIRIENGTRDRVFKIIDILNNRGDIYQASPSLIFESAPVNTTTTSDPTPAFTNQWDQGMRDLIGFDQLASFRASAQPVIVGVIDSGIHSAHPELSNRIHRVLPHNVQTTWHRNFVFMENYIPIVRAGEPIVNPVDLRYGPGGHGTFVAGIIAAMNPNARFVCLRALDTVSSYGQWVALAIDYARFRGIQILNLSVLGYGRCPIIRQALESYTGLLITSAGNHGDDRSGFEHTEFANCAARYRIIMTGAHNNLGQRSVWSGHFNILSASRDSSGFCSQNENVHIFAPGGGVLALGGDMHGKGMIAPHTNTSSGFRYANGTSAAAPVVAILRNSQNTLKTNKINIEQGMKQYKNV